MQWQLQVHLPGGSDSRSSLLVFSAALHWFQHGKQVLSLCLGPFEQGSMNSIAFSINKPTKKKVHTSILADMFFFSVALFCPPDLSCQVAKGLTTWLNETLENFAK